MKKILSDRYYLGRKCVYCDSNKFYRLKDKRIKNILSQFNKNWKRYIDNLSLKSKSALDSIVENKNNIAHGNPSTITLIQIINYYKDSRIVIETIDNIVL